MTYTTPAIYYHRLERYRRARRSLLRCIASERAEGLTRGPKYMQGELASLRRAFHGQAVYILETP